MNILVVGSGGREHAIALAVKKSPMCDTLVCAPGNPGMANLGKCVPVDVADPKAIADLAVAEHIDLAIIGPEIPLVAGVVDEFRRRGLRAFGPTAAAAALEGSKAFSKDIMKKYGVPTAAFETFTDLNSAKKFLAEHPAPIVVKASGLAAGKGAIVCMTDKEANDAVEEMLGDKAVFGESGKTVVIEEFMDGEEASIFVVCDGKDYVILSSAQDHKRVFDDDKGPNTGGMGAYSPAPVVTDALLDEVKAKIIEPTLKGMAAEGKPYTGVLYVGIMVTSKGPKVVEYNCRLGDPECQIVLPLYDGDVLALFDAAEKGELAKLGAPKAPKGSSAIVVLASAGYPGSYEKGKVVTGIEEAEKNGAQVLHAGTKMVDGKLVTNGGRVFGVVGHGATLQEALDIAYAACEKVQFEGKFYRKDIGKKGLARLAKKGNLKMQINEVPNAKVGIVAGSKSDQETVDKITAVLDQFGITWEYNILSAHRTPNATAKYAREAAGRGLQVLIGVAGLAAALPGVLAGHTILPVIGLPCAGGPLNGVDALHSIVQMPPGIPVATVGIGNGKNAGFLAVHIVALSDASVKEKLVAYRKGLGDIEG